MKVFGLVVTTSGALRRRTEALRAALVAELAVPAPEPIESPTEPSPAEAEAVAGGPPPITRDLLSMADRLADLLRTNPTLGSPDALAWLRWAGNQLATLLARCQVVPVEDVGPVDYARQEVVGTAPAPEPALVDHVASTVRPGYRWRDELLRPQQVIVYVPNEERVPT